MENHGLQCGYCTPGMVMAAISLLEENPNPTEQEVRIGLEGNLCRCTGYHNIVKSVLGRSRRRRSSGMTVVDDRHRARGHRDPPVAPGGPGPADRRGEVHQRLNLPGALHLAVLRSPYAHARITSVDVSGALAAAGRRRARTAVPTCADAWAAPMPCAWPVTADMKNPAHYPLAVDKACYVGDGVGVRAGRRAMPPRATRSRRSTSTTSRCRRSSTSKTRSAIGS